MSPPSSQQDNHGKEESRKRRRSSDGGSPIQNAKRSKSTTPALLNQRTPNEAHLRERTHRYTREKQRRDSLPWVGGEDKRIRRLEQSFRNNRKSLDGLFTQRVAALEDQARTRGLKILPIIQRQVPLSWSAAQRKYVALQQGQGMDPNALRQCFVDLQIAHRNSPDAEKRHHEDEAYEIQQAQTTPGQPPKWARIFWSGERVATEDQERVLDRTKAPTDNTDRHAKIRERVSELKRQAAARAAQRELEAARLEAERFEAAQVAARVIEEDKEFVTLIIQRFSAAVGLIRPNLDEHFLEDRKQYGEYMKLNPGILVSDREMTEPEYDVHQEEYLFQEMRQVIVGSLRAPAREMRQQLAAVVDRVEEGGEVERFIMMNLGELNTMCTDLGELGSGIWKLLNVNDEEEEI